MCMAQDSSRKHFLGSDSGERYRGLCGVHTEPVFSRGKSGHNTTILCCARWSDTTKALRTICSTRTSVYYYWQQWASPGLLSIPEACLVVGTCQVCRAWCWGSLSRWGPARPLCCAVPGRMQPQWDSAPSCTHLPCSVTPTSGAGSKIQKRKAERWLIKHRCYSVLRR